MGKNTDRKIVPADIRWEKAADLKDLRYEKSPEGIAKITINRPEVRNAFRPETVLELIQCFNDAREDSRVGVVILCGEGSDAFCSGGDVSDMVGDNLPGERSLESLIALQRQNQRRTVGRP